MLSQKEVFGLVRKMTGTNDVVAVNMTMVDFGGGWVEGVMLCQLLYWSDKTKDPEGWIAKTYPEWYTEVRLTERQVRFATPKLKQRGLCVKLKKFNGSPTLHYRLDPSEFAEAFLTFCQNGILQNVRMESDISEVSNITKGQDGSRQNVRLDTDVLQDSLTETTTETTTDIYPTSVAGEGNILLAAPGQQEKKEIPPGSAAPPKAKGKRVLSVPVPFSASPLYDVAFMKSIFEGTQYEHADLDYYHGRVKEWAERKGIQKTDWKRTIENWMWKDHCDKVLRTRYNNIGNNGGIKQNSSKQPAGESAEQAAKRYTQFNINKHAGTSG